MQAVKRIAVLGSGVMGSQIAIHCAGCGASVDLFGMPDKTHPKESATYALKNMATFKPSPFVDKAATQYIRPCNYEDDLDRLNQVDLVIEAVVEDLNVKRDLYDRIKPHLGKQTILASNTSGISIDLLATHLSEDIRARFLGLHFFNPVRYMRLLEIITTEHTDEDVICRLTHYLTTRLGKYIIFAYDQPAFVANRVGLFAMLACVHQAEKYEFTPDTVDALMGRLIGRSSSAVYRTMDLVGLDICQKVIEGVRTGVPDDPWQDNLRLPGWVLELIDQGDLGTKTGRGIYQKTKEGIEVIDAKTFQYRPIDKKIDSGLRDLLSKKESFADALLELTDNRHPQAQYIWACYCDLFQYAAVHAATISPSLREIDLAWRLGFNAQLGIFETAQKAGWPAVVDAVGAAIDCGLTLSHEPLPSWCCETKHAYNDQGAFSPHQGDYRPHSTHPVYQRQLDPLLLAGEQVKHKTEIIYQTDNLRCWDLGDGVACVGFKTKMHTISFELIDDLSGLLKTLPDTHQALVVWQGDGPFCAGANLFQVLVGVKFGTVDSPANWLSDLKQRAFEWLQPDLPAVRHLPPIKDAIESLQQLHTDMLYHPMPIIAAVQNLALGGGCEFLMHCHKVVAHNESYVGLVEMAVGLLPAGGGCAELAHRISLQAGEGDLFSRLAPMFKSVATATVSTSARHARQLSFLREQDVIMANPDELIYIAKLNCLQMLEENFVPPHKSLIRVVGEMGKANIMTELNNMLTGRWISEHDYVCAQQLAHCLCGGDVPEGTEVSREWIHKLEVQGFLKLLETEPTQARIEHMLRHNKPLRN